MAFRKACFHTIVKLLAPLARAYFTNSDSITSSMLERVRRKNPAAATQPNITVGMMKCVMPPLPDVGNHPSLTENISMKTIASQKEGSDCPSIY